MREGDVLEGRFRLDAVAGSGAMGVVFRGTDLARNATVAIKVLRQADPTDIARFVREAEVLVALQHPNVVRYVAHGRTSANEPFLVMEWLAGETLKDRLERGPLSTIDALDVGLALASALAGAHGRGAVHRDVKPANVFLVGGSARNVKLLDFGVAALRRKQTLTEAGAIVGTPAYMSPEQARGEEVDARSDVFSLGALLFHCLSGERPFQGDDVLSIVFRIVRERAPALAPRAASAPVPLTQLVDAMLEPAPNRRPALAVIASELTRFRAVHDPSLTVSHVVPVQANATLVQPAAGAYAPSLAATAPSAYAPAAAVATVTQLDARAFAAAAAPPAAHPMSAYAAPAARPANAPPLARWLALGGVALLFVGAAIAGAVLLLASGGRSSSSASSSSRAAANVSVRPTATSDARDVPSARDVASTRPLASARPAPSASSVPSTLCQTKKFDLCEPLPFDIGTVDPDAFIALCLGAVHRVEGRLQLAVATFQLRGDRIDTKSQGVPAMCVFDRDGEPDFVVYAVNGHLLGTKERSQPHAKKLAPATDPRCSFGAAHAKATALGARPTSVQLALFTDFYFWTFSGGASGEVQIDARTCDVKAPAPAPVPVPPPRPDFSSIRPDSHLGDRR